MSITLKINKLTDIYYENKNPGKKQSKIQLKKEWRCKKEKEPTRPQLFTPAMDIRPATTDDRKSTEIDINWQ